MWSHSLQTQCMRLDPESEQSVRTKSWPFQCCQWILNSISRQILLSSVWASCAVCVQRDCHYLYWHKNTLPVIQSSQCIRGSNHRPLIQPHCQEGMLFRNGAPSRCGVTLKALVQTHHWECTLCRNKLHAYWNKIILKDQHRKSRNMGDFRRLGLLNVC